MDKKDRNTKPGDNEIVTKKGFLISPPKKNGGKKNGAENNFTQAETVKPSSKNHEAKMQPTEKKQHENVDRERQQKNKVRHKKQNDTNKSTNVASRPQEQANTNESEHKNIHTDKNRGKFRNQKNGGEKHQGEHKNVKEQQNNVQKNQHKDDKQNFKNNRERGTNKTSGERDGREKRQNGKEKKQGAGKIDPSILGDLGFVSNSFSKRKIKSEPEKEPEHDEKIDYSKAIPLRDQIYPPKKEKPVMTEEEKAGKTEIIGVRFKEAGKIYYFDPNVTEIPYGTPVIVETARGLEYGYTAISNRFIPGDTIVAPLKKIIRIATKDDKERLDANKSLEKQAEGIFEEKVKKLGLQMSLVGVEYTFDNTKLLFYFAAESRIDFRELVKELASVFRTRIELRQVGVRDEAKMLGGLGVCGRPLCCNTFLGEFAQVSIKMAKDQNLSLSSSKISGTCGRLLCCLRYEDEVYQQEYECTPKVDAIVETEEGRGVVVETNPLKGIVRVRLDSKRESPPQAFHRDNVKIIGYQKNNEHAVDAELKELEKE